MGGLIVVEQQINQSAYRSSTGSLSKRGVFRIPSGGAKDPAIHPLSRPNIVLRQIYHETQKGEVLDLFPEFLHPTLTELNLKDSRLKKEF